MSEPRSGRFPLPLTLLFVLCLALTALASAALVIAGLELGRSVKRVEHTLRVQRALEVLQLTLVDAETGQRGFLLSGQPQFLEPYIDAVARQAYYLGTLQRLTADNPTQQAALKVLQPLVDERLRQLTTTMHAFRGAPAIPDAALQDLNSGKQLMDRLRVGLEGMRNEEQRMLETYQVDVDQRGQYGIVFLLLSNLASLLGLVVLYVAMRRYERRRKAAQAQLASSEQEFRELFDASPVAQAECDVSSGRLLRANRKFAEITGFAPDELKRTTIVDLLPRAHRLDNARAYRELLAGERPVMRVEQPIARKDGTKFWALVQAGVAHAPDGSAARTLLTVEDITRRKAIEDAREGAFALLRAVAEGTTDLVFAKDFAGRYLLANRALLAAFGKASEDVLGRTDEELLGNPAAATPVREHDLKVMRGREAVTVEETIAFPDGARTLLVTKAPYMDAAGELAGVVGIATDVTARKEAESAVRANAKELAQQLADRDAQISELSDWLLRAAEEERARLAMELHDELSASITAVWVDIISVLRGLNKVAPELAMKQQRALETLTTTSEKMRRLTSGLLPVELEHLGLAGALEDHLRGWSERTDVRMHVAITRPLPRLATDQELALFRVAQEALTNVAKYAEARNVKVTLTADGGEVSLSVQDDGRGMPIVKPTRITRGIFNMVERLRPFNGTLTIQPGPGNAGTEVIARLPLSPEALSASAWPSSGQSERHATARQHASTDGAPARAVSSRTEEKT